MKTDAFGNSFNIANAQINTDSSTLTTASIIHQAIPSPSGPAFGSKACEKLPLNSDLFHSRLAFSVAETAKILGISDKSVRRLIARGLLRPSKALRHLIISKKQIERFLDETASD